MGVRPSGTVTFLFTDIEDSTGLWEREPVGMQAALADHDRLVREVLVAHGGYVFAATGDGFAVAFDRPESAVEAAVAVQGALDEHGWPLAEGVLRVRMGLHTGTAVEREGNYFGPAVNLAARVMGTAAGGQVLVSSACAGLLGSAVLAVSLERAGSHRLAGVASPVELHVVLGDGLVSEVATAAEGERRRSTADLPRYSTSFVGRRVEVSGLVDEVSRPGLVTVLGAGGMGKTRLVVEAARQVGSDAGRPVWFCDLASLSESDAVAHQVASVVGAAPPRGGDVLDSVVDVLCLADGVVVLDNCEHVLNAAAEVAHRITENCDRVTVLATSRAPLGLAAERLRPLGELDPAGDGAVLLAERVGAVAPELVLGEEGRAVLVELCRALDGMPLAIELAAAQARFMSPAELAEHLDDRFELLRTAAPDRPDRQQSVEATVAWSYERLTSSAQRLLQLMSVFAGAVELEFVAGLWSAAGEASRAAEPLGELVDRSMVVVDRQGARTRFRLLETIRAYGGQRLGESGDSEAARLLHARLVGGRLDQVLARFTAPGGGDIAAELGELWPELRAAVNTAVAVGDVELATWLTWDIGVLAWFTERAEARDWIDDVLNMADIDEQERFPGVLGGGSMLDWITGRYDIGHARAQRLKQSRDPAPNVRGLGWLAPAAQHELVRGNFEVARRDAWRNLEAAATGGNEWLRLATSLGVMQFETVAGHAGIAQEILDQVNADIDRYDNVFLHAFRGHSSALAFLDDDPARALIAARRSIDVAREHGFTWTVGAASNYATAALMRVGDPIEAIDALRESLERLQAGASIQSAPNTIRNAVVLLDRQRRPDLAAPLVGWLTANPLGIPGTLGMRQHTEQLRRRLPDELGHDVAAVAMARGAAATTERIVELASEAIAIIG